MGFFDWFKKKDVSAQSHEMVRFIKITNAYSLVISQNGEVCGFWFNNPKDVYTNDIKRMSARLTMLITNNNLSKDSFLKALYGDFRIVNNTFNSKGGYFVMLGPNTAPGEEIAPPPTFRTGEENPFSKDYCYLPNPQWTVGMPPDIPKSWLRYKCPTCPIYVSLSLNEIDPIVGVNVNCQGCKNIVHIPGGFKLGSEIAKLRITGGVLVPINRFSDWYNDHPLVDLLTKDCKLEILPHYGLFTFCANCHHPYQPTVLAILPIAQNIGVTIFNPRTSDAAKDFDALSAGNCPVCGDKTLLAILADVPNYVRIYIEGKQKI